MSDETFNSIELISVLTLQTNSEIYITPSDGIHTDKLVASESVVASHVNVETLTTSGDITSSGHIVVGGQISADSMNITNNADVGGQISADSMNITNNADVGGQISADSMNITNNADIGGQISANSLNTVNNATVGGQISAGSFTTSGTASVIGLLTAGSVTAGSVTAGSVTAGSVTADSVTSNSFVSAPSMSVSTFNVTSNFNSSGTMKVANMTATNAINANSITTTNAITGRNLIADEIVRASEVRGIVKVTAPIIEATGSLITNNIVNTGDVDVLNLIASNEIRGKNLIAIEDIQGKNIYSTVSLNAPSINSDYLGTFNNLHVYGQFTVDNPVNLDSVTAGDMTVNNKLNVLGMVYTPIIETKTLTFINPSNNSDREDMNIDDLRTFKEFADNITSTDDANFVNIYTREKLFMDTVDNVTNVNNGSSAVEIDRIDGIVAHKLVIRPADGILTGSGSDETPYPTTSVVEFVNTHFSTSGSTGSFNLGNGATVSSGDLNLVTGNVNVDLGDVTISTGDVVMSGSGSLVVGVTSGGIQLAGGRLIEFSDNGMLDMGSDGTLSFGDGGVLDMGVSGQIHVPSVSVTDSLVIDRSVDDDGSQLSTSHITFTDSRALFSALPSSATEDVTKQTTIVGGELTTVKIVLIDDNGLSVGDLNDDSPVELTADTIRDIYNKIDDLGGEVTTDVLTAKQVVVRDDAVVDSLANVTPNGITVTDGVSASTTSTMTKTEVKSTNIVATSRLTLGAEEITQSFITNTNQVVNNFLNPTPILQNLVVANSFSSNGTATFSSGSLPEQKTTIVGGTTTMNSITTNSFFMTDTESHFEVSGENSTIVLGGNSVDISAPLNLTGGLTSSGASVELNGGLSVTTDGVASFTGPSTTFSSHVSFEDGLTVEGDVDLDGDISVNNITASGDVTVSGNLTVVNLDATNNITSASATINGALSAGSTNVNGDLNATNISASNINAFSTVNTMSVVATNNVTAPTAVFTNASVTDTLTTTTTNTTFLSVTEVNGDTANFTGGLTTPSISGVTNLSLNTLNATDVNSTNSNFINATISNATISNINIDNFNTEGLVRAGGLEIRARVPHATGPFTTLTSIDETGLSTNSISVVNGDIMVGNGQISTPSLAISSSMIIGQSGGEHTLIVGDVVTTDEVHTRLLTADVMVVPEINPESISTESLTVGIEGNDNLVVTDSSFQVTASSALFSGGNVTVSPGNFVVDQGHSTMVNMSILDIAEFGGSTVSVNENTLTSAPTTVITATTIISSTDASFGSVLSENFVQTPLFMVTSSGSGTTPGDADVSTFIDVSGITTNGVNVNGLVNVIGDTVNSPSTPAITAPSMFVTTSLSGGSSSLTHTNRLDVNGVYTTGSITSTNNLTVGNNASVGGTLTANNLTVDGTLSLNELLQSDNGFSTQNSALGNNVVGTRGRIVVDSAFNPLSPDNVIASPAIVLDSNTGSINAEGGVTSSGAIVADRFTATSQNISNIFPVVHSLSTHYTDSEGAYNELNYNELLSLQDVRDFVNELDLTDDFIASSSVTAPVINVTSSLNVNGVDIDFGSFVTKESNPTFGTVSFGGVGGTVLDEAGVQRIASTVVTGSNAIFNSVDVFSSNPTPPVLTQSGDIRANQFILGNNEAVITSLNYNDLNFNAWRKNSTLDLELLRMLKVGEETEEGYPMYVDLTSIEFESMINSLHNGDSVNFTDITFTGELVGPEGSIPNQIDTLRTKTTRVIYDTQTNTTTISDTTSTSTLKFTTSLNSITPTVFSYLSGVTSNIQEQITDLWSQIADLENQLENLVAYPSISYNEETTTTTITNITSTSALTFTTSLNSITPTVFSYLSGVTSNIQEQITDLADQLENLVAYPSISYNEETTTTTITNITSTSALTFTTSLNSITPTVFGYLSGVSSDIQTQLTALQTKTTAITYVAGTTTTTIANALVFSGTLNGITPTVFGYLSGVTSDIQTQINNISSTSGVFTLTADNLKTAVFSNTGANIYIGGNAGGSALQTAGNRIGIGRNTGQTSQGSSAIAIGDYSGYTYQGSQSVALGSNAGCSYQAQFSVAVGSSAAYSNQGIYSIAIGYGAGNTSQGSTSIAIGYGAGNTNQHANTIILNSTGSNLNSTSSSSFYVKPIRSANSAEILTYSNITGEITRGSTVGALSFTTSLNSITPTVFGYLSGVSSDIQTQLTTLQSKTTAITYVAGTTTTTIANALVFSGTLNTITPTIFGYLSGTTSNIQTQLTTLQTKTTDISYASSTTTIANALVFSGTLNTITPTVFGYLSGVTSDIQTQINNISSSTAGTFTLTTANLKTPSFSSNNINIYIGWNTGGTSEQSADAKIGIGASAGSSNQGSLAIAIGYAAGASTQGSYSVTLGANAGQTSQGSYSVAIGSGAGRTNQGSNSIAIGNAAGKTNQHANTVIFNATGLELNSTSASSSYMKPIRQATSSQILTYDNISGEITRSDLLLNGTWTPTIVSSAGGTPTYSNQVGRYQTIGNMVHVYVRVKLSTLGSLAAGDVTIQGFPLSPAFYTVGTSAYYTQTFQGQTRCEITDDSPIIVLSKYLTGPDWQSVTVGDLTDTQDIILNFSYFTV